MEIILHVIKTELFFPRVQQNSNTGLSDETTDYKEYTARRGNPPLW